VDLDATECAEVADAELVSVMDLGNDRGTWMERSRDGRREYGQGASGAGRIRPATASEGAMHKRPERRGRVDEDEP
jgi:hypothetical protein